MDVVLGTQSDQLANARGQMFLPEYFKHYLDGAEFGENTVVQTRQAVLSFDELKPKVGWWTPMKIFLALLILEVILLFMFYISGDRGILKGLDFIWFLSLSFASIFFFFMWFATDHTVCDNNWNLLWATPFSLFYFTKPGRLRKMGFLATIFFGAVVLLGWKFIPQQLSLVIIPIVVISMLKSVRCLGVVKFLDSFKKAPQS